MEIKLDKKLTLEEQLAWLNMMQNAGMDLEDILEKVYDIADKEEKEA